MERSDDIRVNKKIILSGLWTSLMFCYIYGDYFELYVPDKVEGLLKQQNLLDTPAKLFLATLMLTIPSMMIFLSLLIKARINRLVNIVLGIMYAVITLLVGFTSLAPWLTFYVFLAFVETGISILIVYQAWVWGREK